MNLTDERMPLWWVPKPIWITVRASCLFPFHQCLELPFKAFLRWSATCRRRRGRGHCGFPCNWTKDINFVFIVLASPRLASRRYNVLFISDYGYHTIFKCAQLSGKLWPPSASGVNANGRIKMSKKDRVRQRRGKGDYKIKKRIRDKWKAIQTKELLPQDTDWEWLRKGSRRRLPTSSSCLYRLLLFVFCWPQQQTGHTKRGREREAQREQEMETAT